MEQAATDAPVLTDNPSASRYELHVGPDLAGFVTYEISPDGTEIALVHTKVVAAFQGEGLAGQLARFSLDDARKRGLSVLPVCPYVRSWIGKHPEYADVVPAGRRSEFGL